MSRIVVADAGPIHYLVLIECEEILGELFERVLVPFAVRDELLHPRAPQKVKDWIASPRPWLEFVSVSQAQSVRGLHKGEAESLQVALERSAAAVLMDDLDGRAAARRLGIPTFFTIAILELGAEQGLIQLPVALAKLQQTSFFISPDIVTAALERDKQRQKNL